jgi:hypothetical protein
MNPVSWGQMSRNLGEIMKRLDRAVKKISERRQARRIVSPLKMTRASPRGLTAGFKVALVRPDTTIQRIEEALTKSQKRT